MCSHILNVWINFRIIFSCNSVFLKLLSGRPSIRLVTLLYCNRIPIQRCWYLYMVLFWSPHWRCEHENPLRLRAMMLANLLTMTGKFVALAFIRIVLEPQQNQVEMFLNHWCDHTSLFILGFAWSNGKIKRIRHENYTSNKSGSDFDSSHLNNIFNDWTTEAKTHPNLLLKINVSLNAIYHCYYTHFITFWNIVFSNN